MKTMYIKEPFCPLTDPVPEDWTGPIVILTKEEWEREIEGSQLELSI